MKKLLLILLSTVLLFSTSCGGDKSRLDTNYTFDYAIVRMPDGKVKNIKIKSWHSFKGEQIQVVDSYGSVYLFSMNNAILIKEIDHENVD